MGKPTGFMEIDRQTSREIAPEERIKNFNEFHIPLHCACCSSQCSGI